jgi:hypothetical protein
LTDSRADEGCGSHGFLHVLHRAASLHGYLIQGGSDVGSDSHGRGGREPFEGLGQQGSLVLRSTERTRTGQSLFANGPGKITVDLAQSIPDNIEL